MHQQIYEIRKDMLVQNGKTISLLLKYIMLNQFRFLTNYKEYPDPSSTKDRNDYEFWHNHYFKC